MTKHLTVTHELGPELFLPFESSVDLESPEFDPDDESAVALVLTRYGVPRDRPVLLAFGRAHPFKGFDILLQALQEFPERSLHVVIVAVPYPGDGPYLESLSVIAANTGLSVTFIDRFERALPRALSQWKNSRVVCCPSRVDTLPNVPSRLRSGHAARVPSSSLRTLAEWRNALTMDAPVFSSGMGMQRLCVPQY